MSTTLGCKDIGIGKPEIMTKTQLVFCELLKFKKWKY